MGGVLWSGPGGGSSAAGARRSAELPAPLEHSIARDRGLPQRDAAVVDRDEAGAEDLEAVAGQRVRAQSASRRFWNTPPESATAASPDPARTRRHRSSTRAATVTCSRAPTAPAAAPASRSSITPFTSGEAHPGGRGSGRGPGRAEAADGAGHGGAGRRPLRRSRPRRARGGARVAVQRPLVRAAPAAPASGRTPSSRARSPPGPRAIVWRTPARAATASKSRPLLVVSGTLTSRSTCRTTAARSASPGPSVSSAGAGWSRARGPPRREARSSTESRTPGMRDRRGAAGHRQVLQVRDAAVPRGGPRTSTSPPEDARRRRSRGRPGSPRRPAPPRRARQPRRDVRVVVLDRDLSGWARPRVLGRKGLGMKVERDDSSGEMRKSRS